jgi:hypothetical protein
MKRFLLLFVLLTASYSAFAQDIITRKDGTDIEARILEVTTTEVKYKKFSNLDGPIFYIPKSDILIVRYENGENEVFQDSREPLTLNTDFDVYPGMKYNDYKDLYNTRNYVPQLGDPYTPFWIGFGEFFIPGLGNAIMGEWARAACFFLPNVALGIAALTQTGVATNAQGSRIYYTDWYWVIQGVRMALNVWSICDAVHVSKAKNMYNQDLRALRAGLDIKFEPYFAYAPNIANSLQPVAGLSLRVSF